MKKIRVRHLSDVYGIARGAAPSAWRTQRRESKHSVIPLQDVTRLQAGHNATQSWIALKSSARVRRRINLMTTAVIKWIWNYAKYVLRFRAPFPTYEKLQKQGGKESPIHYNGMIEMEGSTIALAGDWGSGTYSAYQVANRIRSLDPDYTIHLGDVYYSGTKSEFDNYFLPDDAWSRGKKGTFALNGNHEMYSGGRAYFSALKQEPLAYVIKGQSKVRPQTVSYFCLQNDYWRILAIDTGYFSKSFPVLELFDTYLIKLHRAIQKWMKEVVFKDPNDRRPVILLSHHEWFSAFDSEYRRMAKPLLPYLDQVLLWFWGHEHRFSGYAPFGFGDGPKVRARCIGHGGIPFDIAYPQKHRNLVFSDERISAESTNYVDAKQQLGYCGFALLKFDGPILTVLYYDERQDSEPLLKEIWKWDKDLGTAKGEVEGGELLSKYEDGYPKVPPKRVVGNQAGEHRLKELGGKWQMLQGKA
jgi:hypothetical protein